MGDMKEGREWHIDCQVLFKVFGAPEPNLDDPKENAAWTMALLRSGGRVPPYSTSIADAFAVVEKMNTDRCWVEIHNDPSGIWTVAFGSYAPHTGKSLPEAICKAALASVGQGKQGE